MSARERRRVGIIGGGIAGVCLAWLLDGACDVVLFEKNPRLGGHAHTVTVSHDGEPYAIDVGAQIFSAALQPTLVRLLALLGIDEASGGCIPHEMGTTLMDHGARYPRFLSPMRGRWWPAITPWNVAGQWAFMQLARHGRRLERDGDWTLSLDAWLRSVRSLGDEHRERVVLPWLSALAGCTIDEGRSLSARGAVAVPARSLSDGLFSAFSFSHARIGLGGVAALLASRCRGLDLQRGVTHIQRAATGYTVHTNDADREVDELVIAAPPHAGRALLADTSQCDAIVRCLERFTYFRTRMAIHTDPVYSHRDRHMWSAYNATTYRGRCEGSIWYGALRNKLAGGATLDIFKSWATAREREPRQLLHEAEFLHPLITPDFIAAQQQLETFQGARNMWFAGSYCQDIDLQESALRSAVRVAEALAPRAENLAQLRERHVTPRSSLHSQSCARPSDTT